MAEALVEGRALPRDAPDAKMMELYFRSVCAAAASGRHSLSMAFPTNGSPQDEVVKILRNLCTDETLNSTARADLPAFLSTGFNDNDLFERGLARDRVAVVGLIVAADMEKHTVDLTPDQLAQVLRRPALLAERHSKVETDLHEQVSLNEPRFEPSVGNAMKRLAGLALTKDPQVDASLFGTLASSLRMPLTMTTREEGMIFCQSLWRQQEGKTPQEEGMGVSRQARANADSAVGNERFVTFHFAGPKHSLLVACGSEDGTVSLGNDKEDENGQTILDPEARRNYFKRRTPAAITWHTADGNVREFGVDVAPAQRAKHNVLWVHDAAAVMNQLHASSKEKGYVVLDSRLW